jgi:ABC-type dipeptide/oligopeptide/nickel transport system permease subunit
MLVWSTRRSTFLAVAIRASTWRRRAPAARSRFGFPCGGTSSRAGAACSWRCWSRALAPHLISASVVRDVRFADKLAPPDARHWFGTDDYGRDLFSMVLLAANLDLSAAIGIVAAAIAIGVVLGALAGFVPRLDQPLMRITDISCRS